MPKQSVISRMPPSALLCWSGRRAVSADEVKVGVVIKRLEAAGWFLVATPRKPPAVQASDPARQGYGGGKAPSDELAPGALRSIEKQSGVPLR